MLSASSRYTFIYGNPHTRNLLSGIAPSRLRPPVPVGGIFHKPPRRVFPPAETSFCYGRNLPVTTLRNRGIGRSQLSLLLQTARRAGRHGSRCR